MKKNKLFTNKSMLCAILASSMLAINVQPTFAMNESIQSNSTNTVASSIGSTCLNFGWQAILAGVTALNYGSRHAIKNWKTLDKASPLITEVITSIFVTATLVAIFKKIKKTATKKLPDTGMLGVLKRLIQDKNSRKKAKFEIKKGIVSGDYKGQESFDKGFAPETIDPKVKEIIDNLKISKESKELIHCSKNLKNQLELEKENSELDENTKKEIDAEIERLEYEIRILELKKNDIETPRTIMLYGTPGTGKTKSAKCFVELLKASYKELPGTALRETAEGGSGKLINRLFHEAAELSKKEGRPCIIIINEIDGGVGEPENAKSNGLSQIIAREIQAAYDREVNDNKANIYIIATSNYVSEKAIPQAIHDRFKAFIEVKKQGEAGRKSILKKFTKEKGLNLSDELLTEYASDRHTKDFSNRQLINFATEISNNLIKNTHNNLKANTSKVEELLKKANLNQTKLSYFTAYCKYYPKKLASNLASIFIKKDKMIDLRKKDVNLEQPVIGNNQNPLQQPIVANPGAVVNNQQNQEVINIRENNNQEDSSEFYIS